jgi:hypothetical protein
MKTPHAISAIALVTITTACRADPDYVAPGAYGETAMSGAAATSRPMSVSSNMPRAGATASPPSGQTSSIGSMTRPQGSAGTAAPSASQPSEMPSASQASDMPRSSEGAAGSTASPPTQPAVGSSDCNMTGRWIATYHLVADALGEPQYTHYYHYFEIEQQGDALTVTKGLLCDSDSIGVGAFAATTSFAGAREFIAERVNFAGLQGSSVAGPGGCKIDIGEWYTVVGATNPYYLDPSTALPSAEEMASGDTPGWEDWDGDGNPGVTGQVSGIVTGKIFAAPRMRTSHSGVAADINAAFKLTSDWKGEQNVMAYDGTPLLGSESARAADPTLHFAELARLADDQATGDNKAICSSILELAPVLTPVGAGN